MQGSLSKPPALVKPIAVKPKKHLDISIKYGI